MLNVEARAQNSCSVSLPRGTDLWLGHQPVPSWDVSNGGLWPGDGAMSRKTAEADAHYDTLVKSSGKRKALAMSQGYDHHLRNAKLIKMPHTNKLHRTVTTESRRPLRGKRPHQQTTAYGQSNFSLLSSCDNCRTHELDDQERRCQHLTGLRGSRLWPETVHQHDCICTTWSSNVPFESAACESPMRSHRLREGMTPADEQGPPAHEMSHPHPLSSLKWPFDNILLPLEAITEGCHSSTQPSTTGSQGFPHFVTAGPSTLLFDRPMFGYENEETISWA